MGRADGRGAARTANPSARIHRGVQDARRRRCLQPAGGSDLADVHARRSADCSHHAPRAKRTRGSGRRLGNRSFQYLPGSARRFDRSAFHRKSEPFTPGALARSRGGARDIRRDRADLVEVRSSHRRTCGRGDRTRRSCPRTTKRRTERSGCLFFARASTDRFGHRTLRRGFEHSCRRTLRHATEREVDASGDIGRLSPRPPPSAPQL